jgi:hypothetical protein
MLEVSDDDRTMQPDTQSYTTVVNAYGKSTRKDKALQARRILESMLSNNTIQRGRTISAVPFISVLLNAVAHTSPGIGRHYRRILTQWRKNPMMPLVAKRRMSRMLLMATPIFDRLMVETYNFVSL